MGPRNLLILFFSTVAVSLVILIIFFSLFFKSVNLDFNTRLPESAPEIGGRFNANSTMSPDSKADGLTRSTVNVPPEFKEPAPDLSKPAGKEPVEEPLPSDADLPPISDDVLLEADYSQPTPEGMPAKPSALEAKATTRDNTAGKTSARPVAMPNPIEDVPAAEPEQSGPPIPQ